ncbi:ABC transporter ATP-binding protein [Clostridium frigidicarnis]|uniref:ABC-type quaternary amine transporter n=1 Tax=Clostridium frigidicarnis TaxID=84698 RepID=A0A1I0W7Y5_9CLOT|nr:ABC transporter ATP-binding protein [Clostridium frigidicarnis]SFA84026.1 ABC-type Fe3+/spermidine/putrescine transport systems, ATPase components [Clostridium frigidicarnis]
MSSIEIKDLTKILDEKVILDKINLNIEEGCFFTILGASGCGKTTLLKTIAGIHNIDNGQLIIDGKDISTLPMEKRNTPFVFQDHLLFPHMKVFDNIAFGLKISKMPRKEIHKKVTRIIDLLQLNGMENKYPKNLSGGQKQRVSLGRALVMEPKILLLDEPFSSLDINLREHMKNLIKEIHNIFKLTIIFVTHDKEEALCISDKIALMDGGKILQIGTPYEIYEKPNSLEVAKFFGNCNLIEGRIKDEHFLNDFWNIKVKVNKLDVDNCRLAIKSEDIEITKCVTSPIFISKKLYTGDKFIYTLKNKDEEIKVSCNKKTNLDINEKVYIHISNKVEAVIL